MPDHEYTGADTNSTYDGDAPHASLAPEEGDNRSPVAARRGEASVADLDDDIAHLIRRAHQRASATFMAVLANHNLTPAQYFALIRLREKVEVSQNLLGRMAAMDPATIQGVVKRLGQRGLIERVPDKNDRRRMRLHLTDEGIALVDGLRAGIDEMSDKILAPLDPDEQLSLRALLKRIV
jgi:MarR family transcriptional regulator, lower aerobic nicotinate degradation pathway regulator